jgi:N-acetylmuramic acid 6-phosphate (MurNAc-6-P) etherase
VGAMLVSYCIRARIPIARLADKDVRIEAGSVVLAFSTRLADPTTTW